MTDDEFEQAFTLREQRRVVGIRVCAVCSAPVPASSESDPVYCRRCENNETEALCLF